ncbi:protein of unknown function [Sterolibacterium denitrificans]|uniref:Uncharacterized protein n=1 Tax=Sterolibacterium denitrificans TaxID=157592 RepID=A0A7Z7HQQ1_9PROT|nr:protein of unknown function [Sterolibacterium denitrificans]
MGASPAAPETHSNCSIRCSTACVEVLQTRTAETQKINSSPFNLPAFLPEYINIGFVIPAQAGIQYIPGSPRFRGDDKCVVLPYVSISVRHYTSGYS